MSVVKEDIISLLPQMVNCSMNNGELLALVDYLFLSMIEAPAN